jgi:hypothetical protein
MGGLLHPMGPESIHTYWARRVLVLAAATTFVVAVTLIISSPTDGSAVAGSPSAANSVPALESPKVADTAVPTPSLVDISASAKPTPSAKTRKLRATTKKTAPDSCAAKELRPTLSSKQRIIPKQSTTFHLSLINGSDETCTARVTRKNFELKINSGKDRIWSTDDCPSMIKTISRKLAAEHAVAWSLTWDGMRSKPGCKSTNQALRSGSYVATARLEGAAPVKLRMILKSAS